MSEIRQLAGLPGLSGARMEWMVKLAFQTSFTDHMPVCLQQMLDIKMMLVGEMIKKLWLLSDIRWLGSLAGSTGAVMEWMGELAFVIGFTDHISVCLQQKLDIKIMLGGEMINKLWLLTDITWLVGIIGCI